MSTPIILKNSKELSSKSGPPNRDLLNSIILKSGGKVELGERSKLSNILAPR